LLDRSPMPMGPIPVAIALNSFDPGGTEHQMTELMCRLNRRRFAVHAVCLGDRGQLRERVRGAGIPIVEFPVRGLATVDTFRQMRRLARWCRRERIQVFQTSDFYANVFALPAAWLARVRVRLGARRDLFIPERTPAQQRLQRVSYRFAHAVVTNSQAARARLLEEGVAPGRIHVVANGLDPRRFAPAGFREPGHLIGMVANLRPGKGHDVLLAALAQLAPDLPRVRLRVIGDGSRRTELQALAARLGIADRVEFRGHCTDVAAELAPLDVFAFASEMEASSNAVLEAMAAGLPVVATNVGGIPEAIEDGLTGLLVPPRDPQALADALRRLLTDPALAHALGRQARDTIESRFSFTRMASEFEALYTARLTAQRGLTMPAPAGVATD
jgi:glycosyltransferase involved in cell wall biosynthesis